MSLSVELTRFRVKQGKTEVIMIQENIRKLMK